jgi:cellulose biosynthesis protein BcsQ
MAVIAVYSTKGGVGKTTIAVDCAARAASIAGQKTLLWDLDPQGGASFLLGLPPRPKGMSASAFQRDGKPRQMIEPTAIDGLSILQSDQSMRDLPLQMARIGSRTRLSMVLSFLKSDYRRIILDCPPMTNMVSEQILTAADVVILPLPPSALAKRAMAQVKAELDRLGKPHAPILPVLSMYNKNRQLHRDVRSNGATNWPMIPHCVAIEEMAERKQMLPSFAPESVANRALGRLYSAVEMKLVELGRA